MVLPSLGVSFMNYFSVVCLSVIKYVSVMSDMESKFLLCKFLTLQSASNRDEFETLI